ncbi:(2Fe-2S)-binding protein [Frankia sp. AiPs1]|uniref:(2Fe-2S)-binding protein n=1 Tax=Frankia sp. AiPs1 TaxID=573493 RepID=UPI002043C055|nr:(2Fe-2S)-binding protein [Frankia sp. AiPs1]MCM3924078.1 (2Fe-2S)-binding protein [Frankia sp. AiPs1]
MLVCSCFAVSDRTLRTVIAAGARDVDEIGARCDAGTGCGGCVEEIEDLIDAVAPRCTRLTARAG